MVRQAITIFDSAYIYIIYIICIIYIYIYNYIYILYIYIYIYIYLLLFVCGHSMYIFVYVSYYGVVILVLLILLTRRYKRIIAWVALKFSMSAKKPKRYFIEHAIFQCSSEVESETWIVKSFLLQISIPDLHSEWHVRN